MIDVQRIKPGTRIWRPVDIGIDKASRKRYHKPESVKFERGNKGAIFCRATDINPWVIPGELVVGDAKSFGLAVFLQDSEVPPGWTCLSVVKQMRKSLLAKIDDVPMETLKNVFMSDDRKYSIGVAYKNGSIPPHTDNYIFAKDKVMLLRDIEGQGTCNSTGIVYCHSLKARENAQVSRIVDGSTVEITWVSDRILFREKVSVDDLMLVR